ncbi:MAG TPA: aspartate carbamoyltransferase [Nitrososphaerales archaeon]|nr:aspartate carbamoyltransferase [Nitrososphaerales archaeon]
MTKGSDFSGRDVISMRDFSREELDFIFDSTRDVELRGPQKSLDGKLIAILFFEPSTRTHSTFEIAASALRCRTTGFSSPEKSSTAKGETLHDTIAMYDAYKVDCIVMRHSMMGAARYASEISKSPVVSGGDGSREHPTQAMVDMYTIRKLFGKIDGLRIGILGDLKYGRTASSLSYGLANYDVEVTFVAPEALNLRREIEHYLRQRNVRVRKSENIRDVIGDLDVLYVTRIQKERIPDPTEYERVKGLYQVDLALLKEGKEGLKVMHPLPRVDELSTDVDGTPYQQYFVQAAAGVPLRTALLGLVLG